MRFIFYIHIFSGISVCGSGVGTFLFAPLATELLSKFGWKGSNLIFAGLCLNCAFFGALMRPLELKAKITEPEEDEFDDIIEEENEEDEDEDDDEPMQFNISSDRKDKVTYTQIAGGNTISLKTDCKSQRQKKVSLKTGLFNTDITMT